MSFGQSVVFGIVTCDRSSGDGKPSRVALLVENDLPIVIRAAFSLRFGLEVVLMRAVFDGGVGGVVGSCGDAGNDGLGCFVSECVDGDAERTFIKQFVVD